MASEQLINLLLEHKIRPSAQRLQVLAFLLEHPGHPTVEQIYLALHPGMPTLSKSTVYNTLELFRQAGLVRALPIDEHEARYDALMDQHGHFRCERCGQISNIPINNKQLDQDTVLLASRELQGYLILDRHVFFTGLCPDCLKKA